MKNGGCTDRYAAPLDSRTSSMAQAAPSRPDGPLYPRPSDDTATTRGDVIVNSAGLLWDGGQSNIPSASTTIVEPALSIGKAHRTRHRELFLAGPSFAYV